MGENMPRTDAVVVLGGVLEDLLDRPGAPGRKTMPWTASARRPSSRIEFSKYLACWVASGVGGSWP